MMLRRFWFEFGQSDAHTLPPGVQLGCGITAWTIDDALGLLRNCVFRGRPGPSVYTVVEDVDVSTLDVGHVLPNMGAPNVRGIWFPLGYDLPANR